MRPEVFAKDEDPKPVAVFQLDRSDILKLTLPAALTKKPPPEWIFWSTGTCEPAIVQFKGSGGSWTANYSALTARAQMTSYAAR